MKAKSGVWSQANAVAADSPVLPDASLAKVAQSNKKILSTYYRQNPGAFFRELF